MTASVVATALDSVQRDPRRAIALATAVLAGHNGGRPSPDDRVTAERVLGLAHRELDDYRAAVTHLRRAVRWGEAGADPRTTALARLSLGYVLAQTGRNEAALRAIEAALPHLSGLDAGRASMQRGIVLYYEGRYVEAARAYTDAVDVARRHGDAIGEAKALNNRGLVQPYVGTAEQASADFARAGELFAAMGLDVAAADVRWNDGTVAAHRGDVPGALSIFAAAEDDYARLDLARPGLVLDRLAVLLSVPLVDEALEAADRAVADLRARRRSSDLPEALLARARALALAGRWDEARASAGEARRRFRGQRRDAWAALARGVELGARMATGQRRGGLLPAVRETAANLDRLGWVGPAVELRLQGAQVALDLGRATEARELLGAASAARRSGSAALRTLGWYARALLADLDGDRRGRARALRRGLQELDTHRATLGATELRAHAGVRGAALARLGLAQAWREGRPSGVLEWAERWRAGALRMSPARPPRDPAVAAALAELRAVSADVEQQLLAGQPATGLQRTQSVLERRVRDLVRRSGTSAAVSDQPPGPAALSPTLGEAALVELVVLDGDLAAVVVAGGRATLHPLGPAATVVREAELLRFALRTVATVGARGGGAGALAASLAASARTGAASLDALVLAPLHRRLAERPLVLVPTGALHAVPWSMLPTCRGRAVTVAPSAAMWQRAAAALPGRPGGPVAMAAGPRLAAARAEVEALTGVYPDATVLLDGAATAAAVLGALDGARLAHLAAHGTFRSDNPLFSALEMVDGPLTVYDLETLDRAPAVTVLSACDSGISAIRPGDEVMGLTAAFLSLGTRALVATVVPVSDEATAPLMVDLHRRLEAGAAVAAALRGVQDAAAGGGDPVAAATAAAFVCLGAG